MYEELWNGCVEFHGHACPGLAIGYKAAECAADELGLRLDKTEDEDIVCISENESCGVDSIQFLLSCTAGKGNLMFKPVGKMAYSFFSREDGKGVRLVMKQFDRDEDRDAAVKKILNSKPSDIFDVKPVCVKIPSKAKIFESIRCERCGEFSREDKIRFQEGSRLCLDCFEGYDRG